MLFDKYKNQDINQVLTRQSVCRTLIKPRCAAINDRILRESPALSPRGVIIIIIINSLFILFKKSHQHKSWY